MGANKQNGFTIIELLLFITISAAMIVLLLAGWSLSVNTQQYKDSARSLASYMQQQYTNAYTVSNERSGNLSCTPSGDSLNISDQPATNAARGASDCVIVGRYLTFEDNQITSQPIVGLDVSDIPTGPEITTIANEFKLTAFDEATADTFKLPWGAAPYVISGGSHEDVNTTLVIVRSPVTGRVFTVVKDNVADSETIKEILETGTQDEARTFCLDPGAPVAQGILGIRLSAHASSETAIQVAGDQESGC